MRRDIVVKKVVTMVLWLYITREFLDWSILYIAKFLRITNAKLQNHKTFFSYVPSQ